MQLLLQVLATYNLEDSVMVQSFDVRPLQVLHHLKPTIKLGLLTEDYTLPEQRLQQLGFTPYAYNPDYSLINPDLMQLLKRKSIKYFAWTVNDEETVQKLLGLGVDGIITDYPARIIKQVKCYFEAIKTS